ncbi:MAG: sodium-translocating pyrophosphatase [Pirellulales bacterium]|nr:sodium-translocating pyrophosphatase [Pirellulales bacterium]
MSLSRLSRGGWAGIALVLLTAMAGPAWAGASEGAAPATAPAVGSTTTQALLIVFWAIALVSSLAALVVARHFFLWMKRQDEGTAEMVEIAGYVRTGANAYLWQQYKVVAIFFAVIVCLLAFAAFYLEAQSKWVPFAFLTGGFFSGLAGWCGMKTATWASNRTAAGAQKSLNQGLQVAFRSGSVMGLTVVGLGLLDITLWFLILYWIVPMFTTDTLSLEQITVTMLCFGMGASSQALFARVGGGIFTKAADVGADLVGKVEAGIPEDDKRNPATIADNVGDNVGDVAGMGADLYESYCGSILATAALGVAAFATGELVPEGMSVVDMQLRALFLPMVLAGVGIVLSILGIFAVRTEEQATQKALLAALARGVNLSTLLIIVAAFAITWWLMPVYWTVAISVVVGLVAGWLIGKWTEYSTSDEFKPTRDLADQSLTGPATIIIGGIADGMKSVWFPVITVSVAMLAAFGFAAQGHFADVEWFAMGLYGVGIAAVGMLSTLGITLATDAYGPIADNAGGNAEMSGLDPEVRRRTDALDSLGNTTAATGKGFAIGSAALTALALLAAYVEEVRIGFERWGDAVLSQSEPGLYKISQQFIGRVVEEKDAQGKAQREVIGYLAFPEEIADADVKPAWDKLDVSAGPAKADDVIEVFFDKKADRERARFKTTGAPLVRVKRATMPDFTRYYEANLMNPKVLVGVFLGAMATFVFCALTMKAVGRAAKGMVEEVRRQFREKPGIMQGTDKPDYAAPVAISTKAAQWEMIVPSVLGLATPVVVGLLLGVAGVMGLLVGALTTGFCVAVFMANAGGSWDNAKKYIERGAHGGKGTAPHKAAIVGDTVGDPFKDTSGPSLNILIKLMSMVSVVAAGVIVRCSLTALGIF